MTRSNFRQIHDRYSSILQSIRSSHRRVARKLKVAKAVKKLWRTCVAIGAAHLLFFGMLIGPVAAGLICPTMALKRRLTAARKKKRSTSWTTSLLRLREQLDTVAKGTHLVLRLSDGIERENAMAWRCLVEEMVSELRRSCSCSRRLANELEPGGARVPVPCHHTKG
ncbi:hypothetical protein HU200_027738 [Digitaria exilis]|uniref:Uncharacterized protein n=1 Tax=Digitaria exilis TaxID=1010633 RepID=A0A835BU26_9POAL|nr:hypothetical protein HU200_027738 [Digitaria exilis]